MALADYRLISQLGAGADGVAYRAEAIEGGEAVEVRVLRPSEPSALAATLKRLTLVSYLIHPASRAVLEVGSAGPRRFVVLPADDRPALGEDAHPGSPGGIEVVLEVVAAVAVAHRLGLVHGRLDPWAVRGSAPDDVAVDFTGLDVGQWGSDGTGGAVRSGHVAPEARRGEPATAEGDVYSLGALLRWRLGGEGGKVPAPAAELIAAMVAADPEARPPAWEVEHRLDALRAPVAAADATSEWASRGVETLESDSRPFGGGSRPFRLTGGAASASGGAGLAVDDVAPERLGRFRLLEKLGQGGMGAVYRAVDEADGAEVAVKVLRPGWADRPNALRRFRKEARLLARVGNPFVARILDRNEDQGRHYLVLEYVAGESLDRPLSAGARVDEHTALAIAADVARGLADAHRLGVVHRDVKPGNILVVGALAASAGTAAGPRVKLTDFGLARLVEEGADEPALTRPGVVVGTPAYMSPEQCSGAAVDVRADVYALGATLFHLVAGRPPFEAADWRGVVSGHLNDPPPSLRSVNPEASEGLDRVLEKALAKAPADRYDDAGALLADLERLLRGEPTALPAHPPLPACDPARVLEFDFSWDLDSPPRSLWPYVANTDRFDRALGFSPVRYTLSFDPAKGVRRFLVGRKTGQVEAGEEFPYEWVEGRRLGVLREYTRGPFRWVVSIVELAPRPGGGTRLTHRLRIEPSNWLIRLGSRWGIGGQLRKDMGQVYRRVDAGLRDHDHDDDAPGFDPYEPPPVLPEARRRRLDARLADLAARGIRPEVVGRLGEYLTGASDLELARVRPLALAGHLGLPADEVVAACLHAASVGLLVLLWDLLCPVCRLPSDVKETLRAIEGHGHCEACHLDYELDFAGSVELVFRVHPQVREADTNTYCAAGPAHSPHVVAQVRVTPGERLELDLDLDEGPYRLRGPQLGWAFDFSVHAGHPASRWDIDLKSGPTPGLPPVLGTGGQRFGLGNDSAQPLVVRFERVAPRDDALTAAKAAGSAAFRELFPTEVLASGRLVGVAAVSLLLTAVGPPGGDPYSDGDDVAVAAALQDQSQRLDAAVRRQGGSVVRASGTGLLAAFPDALAAVRAGLDWVDPAAAVGERPEFRPRGVVHQGPALAVTVDDRLDYFGATLREARTALSLTPPGSLLLTAAAAGDPGVADLLRDGRRPGRVLEAGAEAGGVGPLLCLGGDNRAPLRAIPACL